MNHHKWQYLSTWNMDFIYAFRKKQMLDLQNIVGTTFWEAV